MKRLILLLLITVHFSGLSQSRLEFTPAFSINRVFATRYNHISGPATITGFPHTTYIGGGAYVETHLHKKMGKGRWRVRSGLLFGIHQMNEWAVGIEGPTPSNLSYEFDWNRYYRGAVYTERSNLTLPILVGYRRRVSQRMDFSLYGGAAISTYWSTRPEMYGNSMFIETPNGRALTTMLRGLRDFREGNSNGFLGLSRPMLEWRTNLEFARSFKNYGAIVLGAQLHMATRRLEEARFVIWEDYDDLRSTGNYVLNRSYAGIYLV